jgi:hypothetical protein
MFFYCAAFFITLCACQKEINGGPVDIAVTTFDSIPVVKQLNPIINEASGIAASKINPGTIWVQEDSGNPPQLKLLSVDGNTLKKIHIKNASNRDWEDMALSGNTIYIADIGDNAQVFPTYNIYTFPEPAMIVDTIMTVDTIRFRYPDGAHDAEAFLIDPATKDIFIITKRDFPARVYKLPYPYAPLSTLSLAGNIPLLAVTGAAISQDGKEILVRTYTSILYYKREAGKTIYESLLSAYKSLPHQPEPMGEAISFSIDNTGFFTLSEKGSAAAVSLYFYKKK